MRPNSIDTFSPKKKLPPPRIPARKPEAQASWYECPSRDDLGLLHRPGLNLVYWNRPLPPGLDAVLESWARTKPKKLEGTIRMDGYDVSQAIRGLPDDTRQWLHTDITSLLEHFALFADATRLRVSFGAMHNDQCRKFHTDYVRFRLITTYLGPGTEWIPEHAVDRRVLERPPACPSDANQSIVRDGSDVRHALAGQVLVMKGALHEHRLGAVHRSPPIEATGQSRVVLVATTVDGW